MASFPEQVQAFKIKALAYVDSVVADVTISVATSLVEKTPVDDGALRANWQFDAAGIPSGTVAGFDPAGAATISTLSAEIKETKAGGTTFLINNLSYIKTIEYGEYPNPPKSKTGKTVNGYSTQAPAGVRDMTVLEFQAYVQKATANLK